MNNELSIFAAYLPTGVDFQKVANSNGLSKLSDGNFAFYSEAADGGRNQKFAAVQGNTLISNSRDLLRSDRGPMKPLIFNWALASPGKLEWLATDYNIPGFDLTGVVVREKRGDAQISYTINASANVGMRRGLQRMITELGTGFALLTADFAAKTPQGIETLMIDWDGYSVAEGRPQGKEEIAHAAVSSYFVLANALNFQPATFTDSRLKRAGFGETLRQLYVRNSWRAAMA